MPIVFAINIPSLNRVAFFQDKTYLNTLDKRLKCLVWQDKAETAKKHKFPRLILMDFVGR
jgi:hypothetical protein